MDTATRTARRGAALLELAVVGAAVGAFSWRVAPDLRAVRWAPLVVAALLVFVVYVGWVSPRLFGDSLAARGLGPRRAWFVRRAGLSRSLAAYGGLTLACGTVIVAAVVHQRPAALGAVDGAIDWAVFARKLGAYCVSGLFQQLIFGAWFCVRLATLLGPDPGASTDAEIGAGAGGTTPIDRRGAASVCAAAALGSVLFHLPNGPLVAISAVLACGFAWAQLRAPNLLLAAASHAVLGTLLHQLAGISMRIGPFYERPERHFFRELFPFLQTWLEGVR